MILWAKSTWFTSTPLANSMEVSSTYLLNQSGIVDKPVCFVVAGSSSKSTRLDIATDESNLKERAAHAAAVGGFPELEKQV